MNIFPKDIVVKLHGVEQLSFYSTFFFSFQKRTTLYVPSAEVPTIWTRKSYCN